MTSPLVDDREARTGEHSALTRPGRRRAGKITLGFLWAGSVAGIWYTAERTLLAFDLPLGPRRQRPTDSACRTRP